MLIESSLQNLTYKSCRPYNDSGSTRYYPGFVQMATHEQNVVQTTIFDDRNEIAVQEAARPDTSRQPP